MPTSAGRVAASLTPRGRWLLSGGCALLLVGSLSGERLLIQLGVFVLALPVLSGALVARERFRLTVRRTITPPRLPRGASAVVGLEIVNADTRPGRLWTVTEQLPAALGRGRRFVVERLAGSATVSLNYQVDGQRRGRHSLGPLALRLTDPFGLVQRSARGTETAQLLVLPRVRPLGPGGPAGGLGGGGTASRRSIAVQGEDDVSTREYRHGDDLRKVHWKATARRGELMVRLEERPWRSQTTLLVDTRVRAHLLVPDRHAVTRPACPGPAGDDAPPEDSLEWLIEAAASIGVEFARRGATLRVVTDTGELRSAAGHGGLGATDLLDRLAVLGASRVPSLEVGVEQACRAAGTGPLICLLGAVGPDEVVDLVRRRAGPTQDLAVLADIESWAVAGPVRGWGAGARGVLATQRAEAVALLRRAGWRVAVAGADRSIAEVWTAAGAPEGTA